MNHIRMSLNISTFNQLTHLDLRGALTVVTYILISLPANEVIVAFFIATYSILLITVGPKIECYNNGAR